jgi:hypothetical protein
MVELLRLDKSLFLASALHGARRQLSSRSKTTSIPCFVATSLATFSDPRLHARTIRRTVASEAKWRIVADEAPGRTVAGAFWLCALGQIMTRCGR